MACHKRPQDFPPECSWEIQFRDYEWNVGFGRESENQEEDNEGKILKLVENIGKLSIIRVELSFK